MKKFHFSLDAVKEYKEKMLESLKAEYGQCLLAVKKKEEEIQRIEDEKQAVQQELNTKNSKGISPLELMSYQRYLNVQQRRIQGERLKLAELVKQAEAKKDEVVEMRKETLSFEKLKEKRFAEYTRLEQKSEEQFIEEFVSNKMHGGELLG